MICDLCKHEFNGPEARQICRKSCGSSNGCNGVRCPRCYYEIVPMPMWMERLFSFLVPEPSQKEETAAVVVQSEEALSLASLWVKCKAQIDHLDMRDRRKLEEIIAMGILPGREIELIQKFPSLVFQMGFSQFSIDQELASCIYARPI